MKADLHIHSTCSDGLLTRKEGVNIATMSKARIISFTDHNFFVRDTTYQELLREHGIIEIPGVEVSAGLSNGRELHITGHGMEDVGKDLQDYFLDYSDKKSFQTELRCIESVRNPLVLRNGQRISVEFEELFKEGKETYFWNEIAYVLAVKYNKVKHERDPIMSIKDARDLLVAEDGIHDKFKGTIINLENEQRIWPVTFKIEYMPVSDITSYIKDYGGIPGLAHPGEQKFGQEDIEMLAKEGIEALEVYSPKNNRHGFTIEGYLKIAQELGLLISGGTDFHYSTRDHELGVIVNRAEDGSVTRSTITRDQLTILDRLL
jgi:3',5'-nucleoside bisphosphate phosphatase